MEVNIVNDIKKRSSSKNKKEEDSSLIKEDSIIKVKNIDMSNTVKEFKDKVYDTLNLSTQLPKNKLGIMLSVKKEGKEIKTFLSDDFQKLLFYDGVTDPDALFHLKDIGAQINYRLVYILEYLGPLLFSFLFFIRYYFVYKNNNPGKDLQVHVIFYFLMILLHYSKRIYESIYVHIFSRTTMPLSNLYKNCAYYWGIFGILCEYSLFNPYQKDFTHMTILRYFFILVFVSGELANYQTHMILREIKLTKEGKKDMPPLIEGFEWVTCANYLWEFVSWISFCVFSLNIFVIFFTICGFLQMSQWALKKHAEMKKTHGDKYKIKYSFIPYIV